MQTSYWLSLSVRIKNLAVRELSNVAHGHPRAFLRLRAIPNLGILNLQTTGELTLALLLLGITFLALLSLGVTLFGFCTLFCLFVLFLALFLSITVGTYRRRDSGAILGLQLLGLFL